MKHRVFVVAFDMGLEVGVEEVHAQFPLGHPNEHIERQKFERFEPRAHRQLLRDKFQGFKLQQTNLTQLPDPLILARCSLL